jgi:probable H4MPT-linked C1 transfer pathway protein
MTATIARVIGWDIGGVNTKAASLRWSGSGEPRVRVAGRYFEVWRAPDRLPAVLREVLAELGPLEGSEAFAVTMTAELSDAFRTKSKGVVQVFDAVRQAFPDTPAFALRLDERFVGLEEARREPREFAAANWLAGALYLAGTLGTCLWIDTGSTTTDVIPIVGGTVCVEGRTDPARLVSGELVYTGALRTPLGAVAAAVPLRGRLCRTAPEYFATTADVHLVLGHIGPAQYVCPTADGRERTVEAALERISRMVCADGETVSGAEAYSVARAFYEAQLGAVTGAVLQVLSRLAARADGEALARRLPVVASGSGAFIGAEVARRLNLPLAGSGASRLFSGFGGPAADHGGYLEEPEGAMRWAGPDQGVEGAGLAAEVREILPSFAAAWLLGQLLGLAGSS